MDYYSKYLKYKDKYIALKNRQNSVMLGGSFPPDTPIPENCSSNVFSGVSASGKGEYAKYKIDTHVTSKIKTTYIGSTQRNLHVFTSEKYPKYLFLMYDDKKKDGTVTYTLGYRNRHKNDQQVKDTDEPENLFNEGLTSFCKFI